MRRDGHMPCVYLPAQCLADVGSGSPRCRHRGQVAACPRRMTEEIDKRTDVGVQGYRELMKAQVHLSSSNVPIVSGIGRIWQGDCLVPEDEAT